MTKTMRRDGILKRLARDGRVEVGELAAAFGVAKETIRRDLGALEAQHLLRRAHGGAIGVDADKPLPARQHQGRTAMTLAVDVLVPDGAAVFLGAGTGCEAVAVLLACRSEVHLIAGSARVALAAALSNPDAKVQTIGGNVEADGAFSGLWAREQLAGLEVDFSVVESEGLTPDGHLLAADPERAAVQSAAFLAARTVILLSGHASLKGPGYVKYARLTDVDHVVVEPSDADDDAIRLDSDAE